jgi:hypothetical protein
MGSVGCNPCFFAKTLSMVSPRRLEAEGAFDELDEVIEELKHKEMVDGRKKRD